MKWRIEEDAKRSRTRENEQGEDLGFEVFVIILHSPRSSRRDFTLHPDRFISKYTSRETWSYSCTVIQGLDWWDGFACFPAHLTKTSSSLKVTASKEIATLGCQAFCLPCLPVLHQAEKQSTFNFLYTSTNSTLERHKGQWHHQGLQLPFACGIEELNS